MSELTQTEKIALYAKTRILTQAYILHLSDFYQSIGVKQEFKQLLNATKNNCLTLKAFFDRSEKLNLEEKRLVSKTHAACSAALLETIENIAMMPEQVVDLYSEELAKFTAQFTEQAIKTAANGNS
jgi:hypothetical protein